MIKSYLNSIHDLHHFLLVFASSILLLYEQQKYISTLLTPVTLFALITCHLPILARELWFAAENNV